MTVNAKFYNVTNKMIAARKLLLNTDLKDNKSEITNTKTKNKLNFMIDSYKKIKSKADETK